MKQEYKELLKRLIACAPVSSNLEAVNKGSACMEDFLRSKGLYVVVEDINGRHTIYASTVKDSKVTDYLFNAHMDVVPLTTPDQDVPVEKDGMLFGRGSGDCLGHAVAAAQLLCENRDCSVGAVFSMDEEIGGNTTLGMLQRGYTASKGIVILDSWKENCIFCAQKGILNLRITVCGKVGHAAYPWNADNALDKLLKGYSRLTAEWVNPVMEENWQDTFVATKIDTDSPAFNVIPGRASMDVNIRYTVPGAAPEIMKRVRDLMGADEVEMLNNDSPVKIDEKSPLLLRALAIASEESGNPCRLAYMNGATDARHVVTVCPNVPVLMDGCRHGNIHGAGEWLDLTDQERLVRVYSRLVRE